MAATLLALSIQVVAPPADFMRDYYSYRNFSATRWLASAPLPRGQAAPGPVNWVTKGAVTTPTSQGRCATCQDFSCVADIEGAWKLAGNPLIKLSEPEMIDCGGGNAYGMKWVVGNGGIASIKQVPLANHSDPNITGCRDVTNCAAAKEMHAAYINGTTCLTNHVETNILALLQHGPMSVSVAASRFGSYHGGIINCSGSGIDHAVTLVAYGEENGEAYWTVRTVAV